MLEILTALAIQTSESQNLLIQCNFSLAQKHAPSPGKSPE